MLSLSASVLSCLSQSLSLYILNQEHVYQSRVRIPGLERHPVKSLLVTMPEN